VIRLGSRTLNYTATVASLPVRDENGKKIADVVLTSYALEGVRAAERPVTFAFNGGPGAPAIYLNLGAIGPKRVQAGDRGDRPSDPPRMLDNPSTWLDFTDLVFVDPVDTGFSRSVLSKEETVKRFYGVKQDVEYLSHVIFDWLLKNGRMSSPKYIVG